MRLLKQYVIANEVTKDHIYTLHMQVRHTAIQVHQASQDVNQLIGVALKQMSLNIDAVKDFGTILHAIPFNTLSIKDFYCLIRSLYIGLMEHLVKKYGKDQPLILSITHAFEHFIFTANFLKLLPGGKVEFTSMMAAIICDVYHINLDELKNAHISPILAMLIWI